MGRGGFAVVVAVAAAVHAAVVAVGVAAAVPVVVVVAIVPAHESSSPACSRPTRMSVATWPSASE